MTPLLDASDRVVLDTCTLDHDALVDDLTHDRYLLTPTAAALLVGCDGRQPVGALTAEHARAYGVDPAVLHEHLSTFVAGLQRVGLARVRRRWRHRLVGLALDLRVGSDDPAVVRRRFPPTVAGCVRAALHAGRGVAWWALGSTLALVAAAARFAPGVPLTIALAPLGVAAASLASVAAHEAGHLNTVRAVGGHATFVAAGRHQVGVIHDVCAPGPRRWVGLAGPLAGAIAAVATWPLLGALPPPVDELGAPMAALLAAGHLAGLLPWLSDGRHFWAVGT